MTTGRCAHWPAKAVELGLVESLIPRDGGSLQFQEKNVPVGDEAVML